MAFILEWPQCVNIVPIILDNGDRWRLYTINISSALLSLRGESTNVELWCFCGVSLNKLSMNKQTHFRWFQTSRWPCDVTIMLHICFYHADATVTLAGRVAHLHQWRHQWRVSKGWTTILENVMKLLADDCLGKIVGRYTPFELISLGAKITIMVETIFQLHNCLFSLVEISMDNVELNPDENVALC